ncbi:MAG: transporter [Melioribacteraceae bacterium]
MKKKYIFILVLVLLSNLFAQDLVTDRPDQTESSSTVPKNSLQIESGILLGEVEDNSIINKQFLFPSTLFRYGLTSGLEIRVVNQFEKSEIESIGNEIDINKNKISTSGFSDLEVGAKVQLFQREDVNAEVAFLSHLVIPTGSSNFSNEKLASINKLCVSHTLSETVDLGYNIGYDYFSKENSAYTYSLATAVSVNNEVGLYIETYGEIVNKNHISNFDGGVTYLLKRNLQFDFSFGTGINHQMNYVAFGVSWNSSL